MSHALSEEVRYKLFKHLAEHPEASQRELAHALGVSLGKINYCVRALIDKGWVKVQNFKNSSHKSAYAYILTPKGVDEKVRVTYAFLKRKLKEYDLLAREIENLTGEVQELETGQPN